MTNELCLESQLLARDFGKVLAALDPAVWRHDAENFVRENLEELERRIEALLASIDPPDLDPPLRELVQRLRQVSSTLQASIRTSAEWEEIRSRLEEAYATLTEGIERFTAQMKAARIHVATMRPTNHLRKIFHIASGLLTLFLIEHILTPLTMIVLPLLFCAWAWSMEYLRRFRPGLNRALMKVFGKMAHPHEYHRVNSATWYATALLILALTSPPVVCSLAVVVLAFGDTTAAWIGRRFGRHRFASGRSIEGTLAFVGAAFLVSLLVLGIYHPHFSMAASLLLALGAAVPAAFVELVSESIDDNFIIPLAAAAGANLILLLL